MKERSITASAPRIITIGSRATVRASTSYRTFNDSIALGKVANLADDLMLLGESILVPVQFTPPVGQRELIVSIHGNSAGNLGSVGWQCWRLPYNHRSEHSAQVVALHLDLSSSRILGPSMVAPCSTACLIEAAARGLRVEPAAPGSIVVTIETRATYTSSPK